MSKIPLSRWQQLLLAYTLIRDPRVPIWTRVAVPAAIAAYVISPVDLIPDVLIGIGQVDDLMLILMAAPLAASFLRRFAPAGIVNDCLKTLFSRQAVAQPAVVRNRDVTDARFTVVAEHDPE